MASWNTEDHRTTNIFVPIWNGRYSNTIRKYDEQVIAKGVWEEKGILKHIVT